MGTKYLMDSNVIIDYLDDKLPSAGMSFLTIDICKHHKIKLPDAIIAATAIFHNLRCSPEMLMILKIFRLCSLSILGKY